MRKYRPMEDAIRVPDWLHFVITIRAMVLRIQRARGTPILVDGVGHRPRYCLLCTARSSCRGGRFVRSGCCMCGFTVVGNVLWDDITAVRCR